MPRDGELLFNKYDLRSVMESKEQKMYSEIKVYDPNRLLNTSTEDLIKYFVEKFRISPIEVTENEVCVDQNETQIDVSNDFRRAIFDRSRPYYMTGTAVILEIPFIGEAELFMCKPSSFTLSPPVANVRGSILYITIPT